jgi:hypothetical protein
MTRRDIYQNDTRQNDSQWNDAKQIYNEQKHSGRNDI